MGQRHDRVQTKSQELQSWTAVSTLLGLVNKMFPLPTRSQRLHRRLQNLYVPAGKVQMGARQTGHQFGPL